MIYWRFYTFYHSSRQILVITDCWKFHENPIPTMQLLGFSPWVHAFETVKAVFTPWLIPRGWSKGTGIPPMKSNQAEVECVAHTWRSRDKYLLGCPDSSVQELISVDRFINSSHRTRIAAISSRAQSAKLDFIDRYWSADHFVTLLHPETVRFALNPRKAKIYNRCKLLPLGGRTHARTLGRISALICAR